MLALAALAASLVVGDSTAPWFRAAAVYVTPDTVWFTEADPERFVPIQAIAYVRRTGAWVLATRTRHQLLTLAGEHDARVHTHEGDTTRLPGGYRIVDVEPQVDPRFAGQRGQAGQSSAEDDPDLERRHAVRRSVLVAPGGARYDLRIRLPEPRRHALYDSANAPASLGKTQAPPFNSAVGWWAVAPGHLFFGFSHGEVPHNRRWEAFDDIELLGGVLHFDAERRRLAPVVHPRLLDANIVAMEAAAGALWVAPNGYGRNTPLLARYVFDGGKWTFVERDTLPLAAEAISAMAADGDTLWLAADAGVAVLDARTQAWSVRYYADSGYVLSDDADTTVTRLLAERPRPAPPDTSRVDDHGGIGLLGTALGLRRQTAFEKAAERLGGERFQDFANMWENAAEMHESDDDPFHGRYQEASDAIADSSLIPFLREAVLLRWGPPQDVALIALRKLGEGLYRSALAAALDSGTIEAAVGAADSLRALGDPRGLAWMRAALHDSRVVADTELIRTDRLDDRPLDRIAGLLTRLEDPALALELVATLRTPFAHRHPQAFGKVVDWLLSFPPSGGPPNPTVRKALLLAMSDLPRLWPRIFWQVDSPGIAVDDPQIRAALNLVAVRALAMSPRDWDRVVAEEPRDQRETLDEVVAGVLMTSYRADPKVIAAALAGSFAHDAPRADERNERLIVLTGEDAAPPNPRRPADARRLHEFWTAWWRAHGASFVPAPSREGEAARDRWRLRHQSARPAK